MATVGIIIGGVRILLFGITWVEPLITAAIAIYIFVQGYRHKRKAIGVSMESASPSSTCRAWCARSAAWTGSRTSITSVSGAPPRSARGAEGLGGRGLVVGGDRLLDAAQIDAHAAAARR